MLCQKKQVSWGEVNWNLSHVSIWNLSHVSPVSIWLHLFDSSILTQPPSPWLYQSGSSLFQTSSLQALAKRSQQVDAHSPSTHPGLPDLSAFLPDICFGATVPTNLVVSQVCVMRRGDEIVAQWLAHVLIDLSVGLVENAPGGGQ